MAELFTMPRLGQSMEEGTVLQWFRQEGDQLRAGEPLLEVMSDKANFEVMAEADGVLRRILVAANETVAVNAPLAIFGAADEPIENILAGLNHEGTETQRGNEGVGESGAGAARPDITPRPPEGGAAPQLSAAVPPLAGQGVSDPATQHRTPNTEHRAAPVSPRARRLADERGVPVSALAGRGTGPGGRVLERDVAAYLEAVGSARGAMREADAVAEQSARTRTTPLAARMADDLGVDLAGLALGLPGSRVRADDVRRRATAPQATSPTSARGSGSGEPPVVERIPLRGLRRLVAENVARSRQTAPHVTLTLAVEMTGAAALVSRLRPEAQRAYGAKLTYTDLMVKAAARALADHPRCNSALVGDEIRVYAERNVGVAVALEDGLIVPVVHQADRRSLGEISAELKALAERCRSGRQTEADLAGGTFTITNLGAFGIDQFDPIIVPPQACILGVGRVADQVVAVDGQPAVRPMMNLCLSFDHRVLDGAPAARFLQRVQELLETPTLLLV